MKKALPAIVFFLFISFGATYAQYGIQVSYIAPGGENMYIFKPAVGLELKYTTRDIDSAGTFRFDFSVGYYKMSPTQDTFPNYQVSKGKLYTGYDVVKDYSVIPVGGGIEYHPFNGKLAPFIGLDLNFFLINYSYDSYIETLGDNNTTETDWGISAFPKIGLTYQLNRNLLLAAGIGYNFEIVSTSGVDTQSYTKSFLSLTYYLNK